MGLDFSHHDLRLSFGDFADFCREIAWRLQLPDTCEQLQTATKKEPLAWFRLYDHQCHHPGIPACLAGQMADRLRNLIFLDKKRNRHWRSPEATWFRETAEALANALDEARDRNQRFYWF